MVEVEKIDRVPELDDLRYGKTTIFVESFEYDPEVLEEFRGVWDTSIGRGGDTEVFGGDWVTRAWRNAR